jgi:bacterioferritin (cytochrome b1)
MKEYDKKQVVDVLNRILESELAGVIRYAHYSFLVYGYNRIPIVSWLREQATESQTHAQLAGEMITQLGPIPRSGLDGCSTATSMTSARFLPSRWSMKPMPSHSTRTC